MINKYLSHTLRISLCLWAAIIYFIMINLANASECYETRMTYCESAQGVIIMQDVVTERIECGERVIVDNGTTIFDGCYVLTLK